MLYTSEKTNKSYKTVEELEAAEKEFDKAEAEKKALVEVKKTRAKEVESAYQEYLNVRKEAFEKVREAEKKYIELKDYHGYHYTYVNDNGKESITFGDLVEAFLSTF